MSILFITVPLCTTHSGIITWDVVALTPSTVAVSFAHRPTTLMPYHFSLKMVVSPVHKRSITHLKIGLPVYLVLIGLVRPLTICTWDNTSTPLASVHHCQISPFPPHLQLHSLEIIQMQFITEKRSLISRNSFIRS